MNFERETYLDFKKRRFMDPYLGAVDHWPQTIKFLESLIIRDDINVFRHPEIQRGCFLTVGLVWQRGELQYLAGRYPVDTLRELLHESGDLPPYPIISNPSFSTTESRVHHLTHLAVFHEKTGVDPLRMKCVVEFGGGYGGMALLMRSDTHFIIDLPAMLFLQSCYLKNRLGEDRVNLVLDESQPLKRGAINLVPVQFDDVIAGIAEWQPDLMVSTWSLSESSLESKAALASVGFCGARYILHGSHGRTPSAYFAGYETLHDEQAFFSPSEHYLFMRRK